MVFLGYFRAGFRGKIMREYEESENSLLTHIQTALKTGYMDDMTAPGPEQVFPISEEAQKIVQAIMTNVVIEKRAIKDIKKKLRSVVDDRIDLLMGLLTPTIDQGKELEQLLKACVDAKAGVKEIWFKKVQQQTRLAMCLKSRYLCSIPLSITHYHHLMTIPELMLYLPRVATEWKNCTTDVDDEEWNSWINKHKDSSTPMLSPKDRFVDQVNKTIYLDGDFGTSYASAYQDFINKAKDRDQTQLVLHAFKNPHYCAFRLLAQNKITEEEKQSWIQLMGSKKYLDVYEECVMTLSLRSKNYDLVLLLLNNKWPISCQYIRPKSAWVQFLASSDHYNRLQGDDLLSKTIKQEIKQIYDQGAADIIRQPKAADLPKQVGVLHHFARLGKHKEYNTLIRHMVDQEPRYALGAIASQPGATDADKRLEFGAVKSRLLGRWWLHTVVWLAISLLLPLCFALLTQQLFGWHLMRTCFMVGLSLSALVVLSRSKEYYQLYQLNYESLKHQPISSHVLEVKQRSPKEALLGALNKVSYIPSQSYDY